MPAYTIYIDESGDHRYRDLPTPEDRFLALTAVVIRQSDYRQSVQPNLEELKRSCFSYDPDRPPILTRSVIVKRKRWFGVLANPEREQKFGNAILQFYGSLPAQVFTVVMDKQQHAERFPCDAFDPYEYSMEVLLNRIRGWLKLQGADAEIICECRGAREDAQIQAAYTKARARGTQYASAAEIQTAFPIPTVTMLKKSQNIAGLQIADLACYGQKQRIIVEHNLPIKRMSAFTTELNVRVNRLVNQYGHYLLE